MLILDTDHMTHLERGEGRGAQMLFSRLNSVPSEKLATTIINYEEQTRGWMKHTKRMKSVVDQVEAYRLLSVHLDIYCGMVVLPFDEKAAVEFQRLKGLRLRTGPMDLKIASIALAQGATLLSGNLKHFRPIPSLKVEDWTH